jgi:hypothetical protein
LCSDDDVNENKQNEYYKYERKLKEAGINCRCGGTLVGIFSDMSYEHKDHTVRVRFRLLITVLKFTPFLCFGTKQVCTHLKCFCAN